MVPLPNRSGIVQDPILLTEQGQVMFWFGAMVPSAGIIREAYAKLGRDVATVFPCRYSSAATLIGGPITGTVRGFMHYRSFSDRTVIDVR